MELELWALTYNTYGSLPSGQALSHIFTLHEADFGPAIRRIEVSFLFPHSGKPLKTLEELFGNFHHYRATQLPKVTFRRSRETVEIAVSSDLLDGNKAEPVSELPPETFRSAALEVVEALRLLRKSVKRKDDFRLEAFLAHVASALENLPATEDEIVALRTAAVEAEERRRAALPWWEQMGVDWRDYHPSARELLSEPFFWDCADEFSPHGNDAGSDLLASYRRWLKRSPEADPLEFYQRLLKQWDTEPDTDDPLMIPEVQDAAIALAFAELKLRGECRPSARKLALDTLEALQREAEEAVDWPHRADRLAAVNRMRAALSRAPGGTP